MQMAHTVNRLPALLCVLAVLWGSSDVLAGDDRPALKFTDQEAVRAIVGEASGEGGNKLVLKHKSMYAIACALRNRGTLKGVYGLNAKHVNKEPAWVFDMALKAWLASEDGPDVTLGATHLDNLDFQRPYWADSMIPTVKIGSHTFYKERK